VVHILVRVIAILTEVSHSFLSPSRLIPACHFRLNYSHLLSYCFQYIIIIIIYVVLALDTV
jgi:hypothetical protein